MAEMCRSCWQKLKRRWLNLRRYAVPIAESKPSGLKARATGRLDGVWYNNWFKTEQNFLL
jgi:hypothetical protein